MYEDDGKPVLVPLTNWALVQNAHIKGEDDVIGLTYIPNENLIERADASNNFISYVHTSENAQEIFDERLREREEARKRAAVNKRKCSVVLE